MKPDNGSRQVHHLLLIISLSILLFACGGGGSGSTVPASTSQGVFLDSAVDGVRFETTSQSGTTDTNGTFHYMPGETVEFYIGDVFLGGAVGSEILTPIDLVPGATDESSTQVTNILRFLQSLDSDMDASNGIQISSATHTAMMGQTLNFAQTIADFETGFNMLSGSMLGNISLISVIDAQAHMRATLDDMTGGSSGGRDLGLGNMNVAGADAPTIGLSFDPDTATPFFTATTASVAWMGGNTNAGNVSRLGGLNISTINGQVSLLQYDIQDYRSNPALAYSYSISCWPTVSAGCRKIDFDISNKRLILDNVALMNRVSVIVDNQATAPITLNGTLYWE